MSDKEKKVTAYHEGGHALVAYALPNTDPVHKVTILPRGRALGYTMVLPTEDKYTQTRSEMMDMLAYALGGRAAEELVFHEPTTGAANDIEKVTGTARAMVMQYGMSDKLGAMRFGQGEGEVFLGRDMGHQRDYSETVAAQIDAEIKMLVESAHDEAWEILVEHRDVLDNLVLRLLDKETVGKDELAEIFASVEKRPQRVFESARKAPKDIPPVLTPAELALVGPTDVNGLASGNGRSNVSANGSANGARRAPRPAAKTTRARTTRGGAAAGGRRTKPAEEKDRSARTRKKPDTAS
jgi:cell division protease FtsH